MECVGDFRIEDQGDGKSRAGIGALVVPWERGGEFGWEVAFFVARRWGRNGA